MIMREVGRWNRSSFCSCLVRWCVMRQPGDSGTAAAEIRGVLSQQQRYGWASLLSHVQANSMMGEEDRYADGLMLWIFRHSHSNRVSHKTTDYYSIRGENCQAYLCKSPLCRVTISSVKRKGHHSLTFGGPSVLILYRSASYVLVRYFTNKATFARTYRLLWFKLWVSQVLASVTHRFFHARFNSSVSMPSELHHRCADARFITEILHW